MSHHVVRSRQSDVTTTTVRRGLMYDVSVNTSLATALLSLQTVFSCTMTIPGTQFSLKEDTMYLRTDIRSVGVPNENVLRHNPKQYHKSGNPKPGKMLVQTN